jgi:nucleoside-diphosphate-sugar epimerase
VYDNKEHPVRETSPRLLDATDNIILKNSDDYSIYKSRGENVIQTLPSDRWTIVRPAITYSKMRYQLVTLEAYQTVTRAVKGKSVILPAAAADIQGTMTWAGDVAEMFARLILNPVALGETYTLATAEHHTWREIAEYYHDICNLNAVWVDTEDYLKITCGKTYSYFPNRRWQLIYDRLFDRIIDNSKILKAVNMQQSDMRKLYDGLKYEISRFEMPEKWKNLIDPMDDYLAAMNMK